jgi:hypothetical protein
MITTSNGSFSSLPNGRIIDFDLAEIRTVPFQDSLYLWVSGDLPDPELEVRLAPRYYTDCPEYWAIEVVAIRAATGSNDRDPQPKARFECAIPLVGVTGLLGITVVGANRVQRIDLAECGTNL